MSNVIDLRTPIDVSSYRDLIRSSRRAETEVFDALEFVIIQDCNQGGSYLRSFGLCDGKWYSRAGPVTDEQTGVRHNTTDSFIENEMYRFHNNEFRAHLVIEFQVVMTRVD
jgi:hypothetical protein